MSSHEQGIEQIRGLARRAELRLRLARTLRVGAVAACAALVVAIAGVAGRKAGVLPEAAARGGLVLAAAGVAVAAVVAWAWRLPHRAGARALDRFHSLNDRLASALAFADEPRRTAFMEAAIDDAVRAAPRAQPRQAVPLPWPRALPAAAALAAALAAVARIDVRAPAPAVHARTLVPVDMAPDDLAAVKDFLDQLRQRGSADTKVDVDEFNRLVDDLASHRIDRAEAFRRMAALDEKLSPPSAADRAALRERVEAVGRELEEAELTRPVGKALSDAKLDQAGDALRQLAKKLDRARSAPVDKARLDQLREALKKAAEAADERRRDLERRREELSEDILRRKQRTGDAGSDEERSLLEKKQRELERLDRALQANQSQGRQLDRLDRELAKAAEDLMNDLGMSAKDLEQGAEDLSRMQDEQQTDEQKEQLRQKLEELRQLLRQQGAGGKEQILRLKRFARIARGQGGDPGDGSGGQGQAGQGGEAGRGGERGQGSKPGQQGEQGQGRGQAGQGGETWIVGPGGQKVLMLSRGPSQGGGAGEGGDGPGRPGKWGEGHDPRVQGKATSPAMGTEDTQVQGADTGQGPSRSQVILGAAERGFSSRGYRKVYTEYHQVAEESFAKDEIPGGYRFYVKRYFQLIRPRDER